MLVMTRHFPPPWDIEDNGACFIVRDNNRQQFFTASENPQQINNRVISLVTLWD
jgi:hypothetical protein